MKGVVVTPAMIVATFAELDERRMFERDDQYGHLVWPGNLLLQESEELLHAILRIAGIEPLTVIHVPLDGRKITLKVIRQVSTALKKLHQAFPRDAPIKPGLTIKNHPVDGASILIGPDGRITSKSPEDENDSEAHQTK